MPYLMRSLTRRPVPRRCSIDARQRSSRSRPFNICRPVSAVLLMRDVLGFQLAEVAEMLDSSQPAFGLYGRAPDGRGYTPQAIQVLTLKGVRIERLHGFV